MKLEKKTIYKVKTKELYDKMMEDCEKQGYCVSSYNKLSEWRCWYLHKEKTCIRIDENGEMGFSDIDFYERELNGDFKGYVIKEYKDIPTVYNLNSGVFCVDAKDIKQAENYLAEYLQNFFKRDWELPRPEVYTVRVDGTTTTVITPDGKTTTAKCHPDDDFDIKEGFRVAMEKLEEDERELTSEEYDILDALQVLGCDEFELNTYIEIIGLKDSDRIVVIDLSEYCTDVFDWLKDKETYNITEILDKYS